MYRSLNSIIGANSHKDALSEAGDKDWNDESYSAYKAEYAFSFITDKVDLEAIPLDEFKKSLIIHRLGYELITIISNYKVGSSQYNCIMYMTLLLNLDNITKFDDPSDEDIIAAFSTFMSEEQAASMVKFTNIDGDDGAAVALLIHSSKMLSIITGKMNDSITWKLPNDSNIIVDE